MKTVVNNRRWKRKESELRATELKREGAEHMEKGKKKKREKE